MTVVKTKSQNLVSSSLAYESGIISRRNARKKNANWSHCGHDYDRRVNTVKPLLSGPPIHSHLPLLAWLYAHACAINYFAKLVHVWVHLPGNGFETKV